MTVLDSARHDTWTDPQGLSSAESARRLASQGPNLVATPASRGVLWRAGRQLTDPMLLLLVGAAGLTVWHGDAADTAIIALVVVVNTAVGVGQELKAERAVAALRDMAAPRARAIRDGRVTTLPAASLVRDDLVVLEAGDVVPADAELVESHQVMADESAVTGESQDVAKAGGDTLLAGTTLTRGRGRAVVTGTGAGSNLGRIAAMVAAARPGPTPLQRRLGRLGRQLALAACVAGAAVMLMSLTRGLGWEASALQAVALAVAAVPESLPAVLTLSLALGARRMARHAAIARELRAVETLGSVTLLATDKTGTLTENRMVVTSVWTPSGDWTVAGHGYGPEGSVTAGSGSPDVADLHRLARDAVLCSDADLELQGGEWFPLGDPTEAALVAFAGRAGIDTAAARKDQPRVSEVPFDSDRGWMLTRHGAAGAGMTIVKGSPEQLLARSDGTAASAARAWCLTQAEAGNRVLAVAEAEPDDTDDPLPSRLTLVGAVSMSDPPRLGVAEVVESLEAAGLRLAVMTGDQPATARTVASAVGLTGPVHDAATGLRGDETAEVTVYARVRPEHKLELVRLWQEAGEVVAVTGDGVNDGPALRRADIGVAMGRGGTEVARQAADLVLTDDRLETVVHAVEEGRRIHDNLRRFLGYALAGGLAEVLVMLVAPFIGFRIPLLPGQILWINMLTHGLPGVAMGAEPAADDVLRRAPLAPGAPILDRRLSLRILGTGTLIFAVTLLAAVLTRRSGADWQTSTFLVLGLAQLGVALASRERGAARRGLFLTIATAVAALLQVAAVTVPPLQALLGTTPPDRSMWFLVVALAAVPGVVLGVVRTTRGRTTSA